MTTRRPPAAAGVTNPALAELARAHGLDAAAAARAVTAAYDAADAEPWTDPGAAARRALLGRLRSAGDTVTPALGDPERLAAGPTSGPGDIEVWADLWAELPAGERAVFTGALLDGLDLTGLARALGTHRLEIKARARRVLSRLAGEAATGSGLAAVRHMTAGEYALGIMPPDAAAPYQRGLALDPELQALVARWDALLAPFWTVPGGTAAAPPARPEPDAAPPAPASRRRRRVPLVAAGLGLAALAAAGSVVVVDADRADRPIVAPATGEAALPPATRAAPVAAPRPLPGAMVASAIAATVPSPAAPTAVAAAARAPATARTAVPRPDAVEGAAFDLDVHVHYATADAGAVERARRLADRLAELGVGVELIDAGSLFVRRDRLRFFRPGESGAVRALATALGDDVEVQDFTDYEPKPTPGTVEFWLATEGAG